MNSIRFGVELETHLPSLNSVNIGRRHNGHPVHCLPLSADGKNWKAEQDSSIRKPIGRTDCEFVSPILSGTEGVKNLVSAIEIIKGMDAQVNDSCGVHVTVEWTGDQAALARLIHLVANFEQAFYGAAGTKKREQGDYCRKIKQYGNALGVIRAQQNSYTARYHILNLTHLATGGNRVEFRCFSGSLNAAKITGWVMMCLAAVEVALDGRLRPFSHSTETETAVESIKRFMMTMNWIGYSGKHRDRARGNVYEIAPSTDGLPSRTFVHNELKRMAVKYDAE
jgi:hypothetical protein